MWLLQKGIVRVIDKVVESVEFSLGVRRMKAVCMAAGVEGGKQVIREQVATKRFIPGESSAFPGHTQAMHAEVNSFLETNFDSYLRLRELNMEDLRQLCGDPDVEERCTEGSTFGAGPSFTPSGM